MPTSATSSSTTGLSTGTLPKAGAQMLQRVFDGVERSLLDEGVEPKEAARRAAQIAWTEVKRHYYKRGSKWVKRRRPLKRNIGAKQRRRDETALRGVLAIDEALTLANGSRAREARNLVKQAIAQGCTLVPSRKHYKLRCPGAEQIVFPKTPSDHRALKNARARLRRAGLELNPSGDPKPRGATDQDIRDWISEAPDGDHRRRRSEAWLQVDRAIEDTAFLQQPVDRSTVARYLELQRRLPQEPTEFNDLTLSEKIALLDGRIAYHHARVSGRRPNPKSRSSLKQRLLR